MESKKHILIIDDEKEFVEFLRTLLVPRGFRVTMAFNGQEGLKMLQKGDPDLLILDMSMPHMGGVEFYTHICSRYGRSRFPVIVLTALEGLSDFFESALVDAFLTKPFRVAELLETIEGILSGNRRLRALLLGAPTPLGEKVGDVLTQERIGVIPWTEPKGQKKIDLMRADFVLFEDGPQAVGWIAQVRLQEESAHLPIVVYTADESGEARSAQVLKAGADRYIRLVDQGDFKPLFIALRGLQAKRIPAGRGNG